MKETGFIADTDDFENQRIAVLLDGLAYEPLELPIVDEHGKGGEMVMGI